MRSRVGRIAYYIHQRITCNKSNKQKLSSMPASAGVVIKLHACVQVENAIRFSIYLVCSYWKHFPFSWLNASDVAIAI